MFYYTTHINLACEASSLSFLRRLLATSLQLGLFPAQADMADYLFAALAQRPTPQ